MRIFWLGLIAASTLFSIVSAPPMWGQSLPAAKTEVVDPYAGEAIVIERADAAYVMNADGTGYYERTIVAKLLSDAAVRDVGVITLPFASAVSHVEFKYARARHADGSVTETPMTDVMEQPAQVTVQAPFYSDLKQAQLPVKGLKVGDTLEWQARIVVTKAESPGQFWGQESFVVEAVVRKESVSLSVPAGTVVNVWTNPKAETKLVESTEGSRHIYRWEHEALRSTADRKVEAEKNKAKILTAEEELDTEKGKLPSVAWTTFKSWAAVGAWYRGLEGDRETPSDEVKAKVAELTKDKTTEEAKVRAVYGYASAQVRYIGVAFGVGRYQPHRAEVVLENQYGDCKDKHTLLASMLIALGLHPDAVLIGAGVRFNEAVPSPAAFNHMITRVQVDGGEVWLDATAEVAPYKMLTKSIRDQEALVVPDTVAATIERTPKDAPFAQTQTWVAKGSLDERGVSNSHIVLTLRGDTELILREVVRQVSPAQYDAFAKKLLEGLGYSGTPTNTIISRPEATLEPLSIAFDYKREQGGDWPNHQIVPQLAPVALPRVDDKTPPVQTIGLDSPRTETSSAEIKIPDGWGVELPEAVHEKTPYVTYDQSYRFEKGTLYSERRMVVLTEKIPATEWKVYKKFQDAVNPGVESYVQLTKTGATSSITAPGGKKTDGDLPSASGDASAEALVSQAFRAVDVMDTATAKRLADQAKAKSPTTRNLWWAYSSIAQLLGERNEALEDIRKELSNHPDNLAAYGVVVSLEPQMKQKIATLREWIAANTLDPLPVAQLINLLSADRQYAEALSVADDALKQLPEEARKNDHLQFAIAFAEMKGDRVEKGAERLKALLQSSSDPLMLNNAAYELSNASVELPLAESSVRSALDTLTKESQGWTLEESPQTLLAKSSLLASSWDTLGWILHREGKNREAETFVEAAWKNKLNEEVGDHLVEIRKANGESAGDVPTGGRMSKTLQQQRTVPAGVADGRDGTAEYRLLIVHSGIEKVELVGERSLKNGEELLKTIKLPGYIPEGSNARLVRNGILNCHQGKCELVFIP